MARPGSSASGSTIARALALSRSCSDVRSGRRNSSGLDGDHTRADRPGCTPSVLLAEALSATSVRRQHNQRTFKQRPANRPSHITERSGQCNR